MPLTRSQRKSPHCTADTIFAWHRTSPHLLTDGRLQVIDLTAWIAALVARAGIRQELVNVHTQHTTTAIIVNEHEPPGRTQRSFFVEMDGPQERMVSIMLRRQATASMCQTDHVLQRP
jgi:hypothetical protein